MKSSRKFERRINRAKREHRTDLKDWREQNYYERWPKLKAMLLDKNPPSALPIPRISQQTYLENAARYAQSPCVLTDCTKDWPANTEWTLEKFQRSSANRKQKLKCGEDDDGYAIKVTLETFIYYQQTQMDDSPLYIFDSSNKFIAEDYSVPEAFSEDLFQIVGERKRPPYRWFLIGPERSGSTIHIDPLQTSAWNALLSGRKLWAVFSPEVERQVAKGRRYKQGDDEAIDWFVHMMPHILRNDLRAHNRFHYFIQEPGETVFIPSGWWHVVLNLDDTIAVTQNFGKFKYACECASE